MIYTHITNLIFWGFPFVKLEAKTCTKMTSKLLFFLKKPSQLSSFLTTFLTNFVIITNVIHEIWTILPYHSFGVAKFSSFLSLYKDTSNVHVFAKTCPLQDLLSLKICQSFLFLEILDL